LKIYENQVKFGVSNPLILKDKKNYDDSYYLLNFTDNQKYIQIFDFFIDILNRISSGEIIINDIVIVYNYLEQTKKIIEFLNTIELNNKIYLNIKSKYLNNLVTIRFYEVNELGKLIFKHIFIKI
jgi:hypothetical protein